MAWLALVAAGGASLLIAPSTTLAREARQLVWIAPAGCPNADDLRALLTRAGSEARALDVHGVIRLQSGHYRLELRVDGGAQRFARSLRSPDCGLLAESAVWLIELAATELASSAARQGGTQSAAGSGDAATQTGRPDGSTTAPRRKAALEAARSSELAADRASRRGEDSAPIYLDQSPPAVTRERDTGRGEEADDTDEAPQLAAGVGFGVAGLGLTGAAPELSVSLEMRQRARRLGLRVETVLHPTLELESRASVSLRSSALTLYACTDFRHARLRTGPCALVQGWVTSVGPRGLRNASSDTALWANSGGSWHLLLELHPLSQLSLEVGLTVGLSSRPSFAVSDTTVALAAPVAGYVRAGYYVDLW